MSQDQKALDQHLKTQDQNHTRPRPRLHIAGIWGVYLVNYV